MSRRRYSSYSIISSFLIGILVCFLFNRNKCRSEDHEAISIILQSDQKVSSVLKATNDKIKIIEISKKRMIRVMAEKDSIAKIYNTYE